MYDDSGTSDKAFADFYAKQGSFATDILKGRTPHLTPEIETDVKKSMAAVLDSPGFDMGVDHQQVLGSETFKVLARKHLKGHVQSSMYSAVHESTFGHSDMSVEHSLQRGTAYSANVNKDGQNRIQDLSRQNLLRQDRERWDGVLRGSPTQVLNEAKRLYGTGSQRFATEVAKVTGRGFIPGDNRVRGVFESLDPDKPRSGADEFKSQLGQAAFKKVAPRLKDLLLNVVLAEFGIVVPPEVVGTIDKVSSILDGPGSFDQKRKSFADLIRPQVADPLGIGPTPGSSSFVR